ncbi:MAG: DinB family protein [Vicinamibacterales bacterium]
MSVPVDVLRTHLQYASWASRRMVAAAADLTAAELTRDFGTADRSVLGTLAHVYAADRTWLGRLQGAPPAVFLDPAVDLQLTVLQHDWPALLDRWLDWGRPRGREPACGLSRPARPSPHDADLQIVLHVVNHGTHHRGQVAGMIRAMGHQPPPLDLIRFYRER